MAVEYVRVSDPQGGEHGCWRTADRRELERNPALRELKQPAVDLNGRPLPPKFKTSLSDGGKKATEATTTEANKEATK